MAGQLSCSLRHTTNNRPGWRMDGCPHRHATLTPPALEPPRQVDDFGHVVVSRSKHDRVGAALAAGGGSRQVLGWAGECKEC